MILFDTNILIYGFSPESHFYGWSNALLTKAVSRSEAIINPVILAELCVGDGEPETVPDRVRSWGLLSVDLPAAASTICAEAFRKYLLRREEQGQAVSSKIPLPDFFIGAHAQLMDWKIATADLGRYQTYFPQVELVVP